MDVFFNWFMDAANSKIVVLMLLFPAFIGVLIYVYTNKSRKERLESYKYIPFQDDADNSVEAPQKEGGKKNG